MLGSSISFPLCYNNYTHQQCARCDVVCYYQTEKNTFIVSLLSYLVITDKFLLYRLHISPWLQPTLLLNFTIPGVQSHPPLYAHALLVPHTRCFNKSKHMRLLRKLTLDNLVCGVPPAIFHSIPSLPRIYYNFIWSYFISINKKIYYHHYWSALKKKKKKEINMPVNTDYKKKEVVVFM